MSIDEIKKRAKLSLDEMHDNQHVGKTAIQQADQQSINSEMRNPEHKKFETNYRELNQKDKQTGNRYTKKMTFWMTEEIYDTFNEIHAKRTLAKKKVDKGALFCEIMQFFIENQQDR